MKKKLLQQLKVMAYYGLLGIFLQGLLLNTVLASDGNAQTPESIRDVPVNVAGENLSLREVFDHIEEQTSFEFSYDAAFVDDTERVSIVDINQSLFDLLKQIANEKKMSFRRVDNTIFIKKTDKKGDVEDVATVVVPATQLVISGQVTDEMDEPLPGVNIVEKGTYNGTVSDANGQYTITLSGDDPILVFSFIGYKTQEILVGSRSVIDVKLDADITALEEIVVIGYGSVKKSDLTGSVTSIKAEDFNQGANTSVAQLIQGKVAGAQIISNSGAPGAGLAISIRGSSSINAGTEPLYVIDGLPVDNSSAITGTGAGFPGTRSHRSPLNGLNTSDIESIEILKDASATAIYGARGANGVILITTKRGQEGKATISYDTYVGIQNPANKLDMLNAQEYQKVLNDIIAAGGGSPSDDPIDEIIEGGTDWQEQVYNKNALVYNHNISVSGGTKATQYFTSFNLQEQEGVISNSNYKKYGIRLNLDSKLSDKLTVGLNFNTAYIRDEYIPNGYAINENGGVLYSALYFDPTVPVRDAQGNFYESNYLTIENPLALIHGTDSYANTISVIGTAFGEYELTPDWSVKLTLGGDAINQRRDTYVSKLTQKGRGNGGIATILNGQKSNYLVEASTTFNKQIDAHSFNIFAGATTQKFITVRSSQSAENFSIEATKTDNIGLGDQETYTMGSGKFSNKLISFIGRVNYGLSDKYLVTATFRADGSSRFGANNKFGYFPSLAGAWKMAQEDFLNDVNWLSDLKLRASWGRTGNQAIPNYQSISTFGAGSPAHFGQSLIVSLSPERIAQPDLKWETTEQWDVGVDFGFFNGRLIGSIDYYQKSTSDMLIALPIPRSTGFETLMSNVGRIDNKGVDISLTSVNVASNDFNWTTTANVSTLRNEVKDLGGIPRIITGGAGFTGQIFIIEEGAPLRSFYGWVVDGVWQEGDDFSVTTDKVNPGDLKYRDVIKDKDVNDDDRVILGDGFPDFIFSVGNNFTYKNLNLDVFIQGVQGVEMLNNNLVDTYFPIQLRRNKLAEPYLNRWTPENPSNKYPSFVDPTGQGRRAVNSYTVEDASYVRLKSVRLSYTFPQNFLGNAIQGLTFYVSGQNLITLTDYSGIDPGVNSNGTANTNIDFNTYPLARTYMAGLRIDF